MCLVERIFICKKNFRQTLKSKNYDLESQIVIHNFEHSNPLDIEH